MSLRRVSSSRILVCSCGSQRSFERPSMILVTGGTGLIGSEVLRLLSRAGGPPRALLRNPGRAQALPGITWVQGDLAKTETLASVFAGCTKLFLLIGYVDIATDLQRQAIAAAPQAGVAPLAELSAFGTER